MPEAADVPQPQQKFGFHLDERHMTSNASCTQWQHLTIASHRRDRDARGSTRFRPNAPMQHHNPKRRRQYRQRHRHPAPGDCRRREAAQDGTRIPPGLGGQVELVS
jgi:hypothetical protein